MSPPAHITIVDDDQSIREALPKLLRSYGFIASALGLGEELLTSPLLDATDCFVLDIAMPGMSGPDLFQELKTRRPGVPVIFITAHGNEAIRQHLLDEGAIAFLHKPFEPTAIIDSIEAALGKI